MQLSCVAASISKSFANRFDFPWTKHNEILFPRTESNTFNMYQLWLCVRHRMVFKRNSINLHQKRLSEEFPCDIPQFAAQFMSSIQRMIIVPQTSQVFAVSLTTLIFAIKRNNIPNSLCPFEHPRLSNYFKRNKLKK